MALSWDVTRRRWRNDAGRLVTNRQSAQLRNDLAIEYETQFRDLATAYVSGSISETMFRSRFSDLVIKATAAGYAFGGGGIPFLSDGDYDLMAEIIAAQLAFADGFFSDLAQREIAAAQEGLSRKGVLEKIADWTRGRAGNYGSAVVAAYEKANVAARLGLEYVKLDFPVYPADFKTPCKHRCRCYWSIGDEQPGGAFDCVWITEDDDDVCDGCRARGEQYGPDSPIRLFRPVENRDVSIRPLEQVSA